MDLLNSSDFAAAKKSVCRKSVLLAEDDFSMRQFLTIVLKRAGYEVTSAENGAAALQIALENEFDIIILDALMPELSGYELCRILKNHPARQKTPIVMLSGLDKQFDSEADAHLLKTALLQEELLNVLARF